MLNETVEAAKAVAADEGLAANRYWSERSKLERARSNLVYKNSGREYKIKINAEPANIKSGYNDFSDAMFGQVDPTRIEVTFTIKRL